MTVKATILINHFPIMLTDGHIDRSIGALRRISMLLAGLFCTATLAGLSTTGDKPRGKMLAAARHSSYNDPALVQYGKELVTHTATYLGPRGKVARLSNGMNCQNCHLDAGTKFWGNNYRAVAATYPKFRERSGSVENVVKRVNDCIERSLNGKALDSNSREMKAFVAYIISVGQDVPKGDLPKGTGIWPLPYLDRAASPALGKLLYKQKCVTCHGATGQGVVAPDGTEYTYPPLWGSKSYNQGAGLFRISRLAGYIKTNMPLGASWETPLLSNDEAWDIAAYIESMPRPTKDLRHDWPNLAGKPIDHPFGPYTDPFPEEQHKYGPFAPIKKWQEQHKASR
ncbi:c-type cytochrome [Fibrella sp. USSR17]